MLVGDREQTSTKWPHECLQSQMVWCVKGLMNHPIPKDATNVGLLRTHRRGRGSIKVEWYSRKRDYAIVIRECSKERQSFRERTKARGSNTTIMTLILDISVRPRENIHQAAQGLPPFANGLVVQGLNGPPNSQGCSQCGLLCSQKRGGDNIKVERNSRMREYAIITRECSEERKSFTKGTEAWESNTTIMT